MSQKSIPEILKSDNWRDLIRARFPDCDLSWWQSQRDSMLAAAAKPKKRRKSTPRKPTCRLTATQAFRNLQLSTIHQAEQRGKATVELVERANANDETSAILVNAGNQFMVMEV